VATFACGAMRRISPRDEDFRAADVAQRRSDHLVQICFLNNIGIDQEKPANTEMGELLHDNRAGAAQVYVCYPRVLNGMVTVLAERGDLPVMDQADGRRPGRAMPRDHTADLPNVCLFSAAKDARTANPLTGKS
jgi:hypothetical protein